MKLHDLNPPPEVMFFDADLLRVRLDEQAGILVEGMWIDGRYFALDPAPGDDCTVTVRWDASGVFTVE